MSVEARPGADDPYVALQETDEFQNLRKKFRGFVFPMTAFFLTWYFLYVLLSIFAPGFMNKPISGLVTVGLVFGLLQFVRIEGCGARRRRVGSERHDRTFSSWPSRSAGMPPSSGMPRARLGRRSPHNRARASPTSQATSPATASRAIQ